MNEENLEDRVKELISQGLADREYLEAFCRHFEVELVGIDWTAERCFYERMYFFSDELGGYTIEGIIGSLLHN